MKLFSLKLTFLVFEKDDISQVMEKMELTFGGTNIKETETETMILEEEVNHESEIELSDSDEETQL